MKKIVFVFLLALLLLSACQQVIPIRALAVVYYVAPSGSDTNPGTSAAPWRTIQHAADVMQAGDSVTVRAGDYGRVTIRASGSAVQPITYRAEGVVKVHDFDIQANHVVVDGFDVSNSVDNGGNLAGISIAGHGNVIQNNGAHHLTFIGNTIAAYDGLLITDGSDVVISGNTFRSDLRFYPGWGQNGADITRVVNVMIWNNIFIDVPRPINSDSNSGVVDIGNNRVYRSSDAPFARAWLPIVRQQTRGKK